MSKKASGTRAYQPIWEELKTRKKLQVLCFKDASYTLRRMIAKEKHEDIGFKLESRLHGHIYKMAVTEEPSEIGGKVKLTFTLYLLNASLID